MPDAELLVHPGLKLSGLQLSIRNAGRRRTSSRPDSDVYPSVPQGFGISVEYRSFATESRVSTICPRVFSDVNSTYDIECWGESDEASSKGVLR